jgi:phage gp29-like protein
MALAKQTDRTPPKVRKAQKARARMSSASRGRVIPDLALWSQSARIGGGITPARISQIIREADSGEIRRLVDLANECRQRDAHLQAVLSVAEESIAGLPWQIVSTAAKPRAKDKKAAAWVEETLRGNPGFQRLIADLAGAIFYSFACVEIVWTKKDGKLIPNHFVPVAPRRFRFRNADSQLVLHDDGAQEVLLEDEHPNKFIFSRPRVTGDVPTREGLLRVLVWMSVMRNWSIGDWLKTGELSWKPWRIGTYKKSGSSREDREDLETVMQRLTTDFSAVIPDSAEIRIEWPGGAGNNRSTHSEICAALAREQSKAVLGQTETTESSSSSGYGQAKVHDSVRRDLREARARAIAADITRDLIAAMVRLNFGDSIEPLRLEFITQDPIDLEAFSKAISNLATSKLRIPQSWVREQAGIPEPQDDEPVLGEGEDDGSGEDGAGEGGAKKPAAEDKPPTDDEAEDATEPDTED